MDEERMKTVMKKLIAITVALVMGLYAAAALAETKITVNGTGEVRVSR